MTLTPEPDPPAEPRWQTVFSELKSGLLAVSGTGPKDVYIVGTDAGDGKGPLVAHYNGQTWRRLSTGAEGHLWWITAVPVDGQFYMAGDRGLVLRFDPATETFERHVTPGEQSIFGVWGFSQNDIWAVGGLLGNQQTGGAIWHYDGATWSVQDLSNVFGPGGHQTIFKVWGRAPNDVYAVGSSGIILHYDGVEWNLVPNGTGGTPVLFSVYGNADTVAAVGGFNTGFILERQGSDFLDRAVPGTNQMNGIFLTPGGHGVAVGRELNVAFRTATGWEVQETGLPNELDFHANWIDSDGGMWAVGGNLISVIDRGILVYYGTQDVPTTLVEP